MGILEDGFFFLNKPAGLTSFDCLARLQKEFLTQSAGKKKNLGHGGTLDSFATGVLPVFWGDALKFSRYFLESFPTLPTYWKTYEATLKLGVETDTLDPTGTVIKEAPMPNISESQLERLKELFTNEPYLQTPPAFSAKKIQGKRASDLIRAGEDVKLTPIPCVLRDLKIQLQSSSEIHFQMTCSKGTYVRSFGKDLAAKLETVGHLTQLKRLACGPFDLKNCLTFEELRTSLDRKDFSNFFEKNDFFKIFPKITVEESRTLEVLNGKKSTFEMTLKNKSPGIYLLASCEKQVPLALVEKSVTDKLNIHRVFKTEN